MVVWEGNGQIFLTAPIPIVVETNVHFLADTSQLYDAMRKVLKVFTLKHLMRAANQLTRQFKGLMS